MEPTFEWDAKKARRNLRKHGVSFEEAKLVLLDPLSITVADPAQTVTEDRFVDIGTSTQGRVLVVVYTERGSNIRLISCRQATSMEVRVYEQGYLRGNDDRG